MKSHGWASRGPVLHASLSFRLFDRSLASIKGVVQHVPTPSRRLGTRHILSALCVVAVCGAGRPDRRPDQPGGPEHRALKRHPIVIAEQHANN
jgi:hypothetical protein